MEPGSSSGTCTTWRHSLVNPSRVVSRPTHGHGSRYRPVICLLWNPSFTLTNQRLRPVAYRGSPAPGGQCLHRRPPPPQELAPPPCHIGLHGWRLRGWVRVTMCAMSQTPCTRGQSPCTSEPRCYVPLLSHHVPCPYMTKLLCRKDN